MAASNALIIAGSKRGIWDQGSAAFLGVGSGIATPGSGITTRGIGISSVFVESGIKILNVLGIRDQNSQRF